MFEVKYDEDENVIVVDNGVTYFKLSKDDAYKLGDLLKDMVTKLNLQKLRKDFKYEGNSL